MRTGAATPSCWATRTATMSAVVRWQVLYIYSQSESEIFSTRLERCHSCACSNASPACTCCHTTLNWKGAYLSQYTAPWLSASTNSASNRTSTCPQDHRRGQMQLDTQALVSAGAAPDAAAAAAKAHPTAVTSLVHLNEVHAAVLLAGCADGTVRVWRNHTFRGQQRLSAAFQVCHSFRTHGHCTVSSFLCLVASFMLMLLSRQGAARVSTGTKSRGAPRMQDSA